MGSATARTWYALGQQLSGMALMVAFAVASSRWLGPSGKGELAIVTTAGVVAGSLLALGIPQALTAWVARDRMSVRRAIVWGTVWAAALSVFLLLATLIMRPGSIALGVLWLSVGVFAIEQTMSGVSAGSGDLIPPLISRWVGGGAQVALMSAALVLGLEVDIASVSVAFYVLGLIGVVVAIVFLVGRSGSVGRPVEASRQSNREDAVGLAAFGLKTLPGQILSMTNLKLDILLLGWFATTAAVGIYSLAVSATLLVGVLPAALGQALTRSFGTDSDPTVRLRRGFQIALFTGLVSGAVIVILSPWLVPIVFGEAFSSASSLIAVMVPFTAAFATVQVTFPYFFNRLHRPLIQSLVIGTTAAVDVVLVILLAPRYGAMGAAAASAIAYGLGFVVNVVITARGAEMSIRQLMVPDREGIAWAMAAGRRALRLGGG